MRQVDLELCDTGFVAQGSELDLLRLAEVVDVVDERVVFVQRVDAVRLAASFDLPGASLRRPQGIVRVRIALDEIELELRCDDGAPAALAIELEHLAQHMARGGVHRAAVGVETVVDDLRGGFRSPRNEPDGAFVGPQHHVAIRRVDRALILGIVSGNGLQHECFREIQTVRAAIRGDRHDLAARDAGHVGHQRFHLGNRVLAAPAVDVAHGAVLLERSLVTTYGASWRRHGGRSHAILACTVSVDVARHFEKSRHAAPNAANRARDDGSLSAFHSGCH